jgi:hypothetical protein
MQVDLTKPPSRRWALSPEQVTQARGLLEVYQRDLGIPSFLVAQIARPIVHDDYWGEMESLAAQAGVPVDDVVCGNLYYDALKTILMACTAFAVDTPSGPLHARNLDWWTENGLLASCTMSTRFLGAPAGEFTIVGWPGFVGAFSAIAPGRFAVSLNAVLSDEPPQAATPIVFLLRQVLETAPDFQSALDALTTTPVASDSLLLLTGTRAGEMAVVERTPTRGEVRHPIAGRLFVTNDYRAIETGRGRDSELHATACARYDRASNLVAARPPRSAEECLAYLDDPAVRMGITVQQMVFQASSGMCVVR